MRYTTIYHSLILLFWSSNDERDVVCHSKVFNIISSKHASPCFRSFYCYTYLYSSWSFVLNQSMEICYLQDVHTTNTRFTLHYHLLKTGTENDNNFGYEKITILVDNIPLKHPHREGTLSNTWGRDWQLYASSPGNLHQYSLRSYKKL